MPFMLWQDLQRVYVRHICPNLCSVLVLHACQIAYVCISRYVPCQIAMEYMHYMIYIYNRRKFRSQTSDSMDRWKKQRWEESEKRRAEERRPEKRKSEKKEDAGARKGSKVAKHCVFSNDLWLRRLESRLAKAGAEPCGQLRDEKLHAVVPRSKFGSQKVQNTPKSDF